MRKEKRKVRTKLGPLIFFLIYVLIGGIIGVAINSRYYAIERNEQNTIHFEP
jgi:hypothetical protein